MANYMAFIERDKNGNISKGYVYDLSIDDIVNLNVYDYCKKEFVRKAHKETEKPEIIPFKVFNRNRKKFVLVTTSVAKGFVSNIDRKLKDEDKRILRLSKNLKTY